MLSATNFCCRKFSLDQHLIGRHSHRAGSHQDSLRRHTPPHVPCVDTVALALAAGPAMVLHHHDGRHRLDEMCLPVGQDLFQGRLPAVVSDTGMVSGLDLFSGLQGGWEQ